MIFDEGQPVKLVPVVKVPGRGIILDAGRTEPFPDELFPAPQTSSFLPVDNYRPWLRSIPRSHNFSSPTKIELKKKIHPDSGNGQESFSAKAMPFPVSLEGNHER